MLPSLNIWLLLNLIFLCSCRWFWDWFCCHKYNSTSPFSSYVVHEHSSIIQWLFFKNSHCPYLTFSLGPNLEIAQLLTRQCLFTSSHFQMICSSAFTVLHEHRFSLFIDVRPLFHHVLHLVLEHLANRPCMFWGSERVSVSIKFIIWNIHGRFVRVSAPNEAHGSNIRHSHSCAYPGIGQNLTTCRGSLKLDSPLHPPPPFGCAPAPNGQKKPGYLKDEEPGINMAALKHRPCGHHWRLRSSQRSS